jgi:hypothetical protein
MIKNVKMQVTPEQTRMIQKIVFDNNGTWLNLTKTCDWLIVTASGDISWGTQDVLKCYSEISAEEWLMDTLNRFPIYKMHASGDFIVGFDGDNSGQVVWRNSNSETKWNIGDYENDWVYFNNSQWKDVDINLYLSTECDKTDESIELEKDMLLEDIPQGTIVRATRKSNSDKHSDYIWQGVYFGYCNGKHLIDANTTHVMLADEVQAIPTISKKEAKQRISELFANPKNVTSDKIRNIIDLIKD